LRSLFSLFVLLIMIAAAWLYAGKADTKETIISTGQTIRAADGDSFAIGSRKLRLYGIDAPELKQTCNDAAGQIWQCGAAAHGALITLLAQPGLTCQANAQDRFGRSLATCSAINTADIAAVQVRSGMAVSNEFNGIREYGAEEDEARAAKIGIWQGSFDDPKEWRASHGRGPPKAALKPTS
jgi:endonuclease YncB( thermonuclease family)